MREARNRATKQSHEQFTKINLLNLNNLFIQLIVREIAALPAVARNDIEFLCRDNY